MELVEYAARALDRVQVAVTLLRDLEGHPELAERYEYSLKHCAMAVGWSSPVFEPRVASYPASADFAPSLYAPTRTMENQNHLDPALKNMCPVRACVRRGQQTQVCPTQKVK